MNLLAVQSSIQGMESPRPGLRRFEASRLEASRPEFSQIDASYAQSSQFDARAWDHWLLIVVAVSFSIWVLRTSWSWQQESRRRRSIPDRSSGWRR